MRPVSATGPNASLIPQRVRRQIGERAQLDEQPDLVEEPWALVAEEEPPRMLLRLALLAVILAVLALLASRLMVESFPLALWLL